MIQLKSYQKEALETLRRYLEHARFRGSREAYELVQRERFGNDKFKPFQPLERLEEVPYACLRLPTGGGKTLLASHSIALAAKSCMEEDYPLTLWLVPTKAIKNQTLKALKDPKNANYEALREAFGGRFRVFDIEDFPQIRPRDLSDAACIILATFASLRVKDTAGRKVYSHHEDLEPHFSKVSGEVKGMELDAGGQVKFSLANLLRLRRPLAIVDEAHNAKTDLSVEVLHRVRAACVVEYTATPASNSNVIHSSSASALKDEEMIKLPIMFSEHISWDGAVAASIQKRNALEAIAAKGSRYIRPMVLFQAQNKNGEVNVDVLKKHLVDNESIPENKIAIATGSQRELDLINLFDSNCPICYVITVEALKEGWDCSFAYVLCSLAHKRSATAVEQLLGRVLRMPCARRHEEEALNRAYAYVSSESWICATSHLRDHLINMGFEKQEAEAVIYTQNLEALSEEGPTVRLTLGEEPNLSELDEEERKCVKVEKVSEGRVTLEVQKPTDELLEKIEKGAKNKKDKEEIRLKSKLRERLGNNKLADRKECFCVPRPCLDLGDRVELLEPESFLDNWSLLDCSAVLDASVFRIDEKARCYKADVEGGKVIINFLDTNKQLKLGNIATMTDQDLCLWLSYELKQEDIRHEVLLEFLRKAVKHLLNREDLDMLRLQQAKFILKKVLEGKIKAYREEAQERGFQKLLVHQEKISVVCPKDRSFLFDPESYPADKFHQGTSFRKHYYPKLAFMNKEELQCAEALDRHDSIKFWVRNLERKANAFWLPTATRRFYPDFVAKLNDGCLLVVEYKGSHLKDSKDTGTKKFIGEYWAQESKNLFLMALNQDANGRDVSRQINFCLDHAHA